MSGKFVVKELWDFLKTRKLLWVIPTIIVVIVFGIVLISSDNSNAKKFTYQIF